MLSGGDHHFAMNRRITENDFWSALQPDVRHMYVADAATCLAAEGMWTACELIVPNMCIF